MTDQFEERLSPVEFARRLRENPTKAESAILFDMQDRGFFFQQPCGEYVVDFFSPELLIIVEIDGWSHKYQARKDQTRENDLLSGCYLIIRIPNSLALSMKGRAACLPVLDRILELVRVARSDGIYLTGVWKIKSAREARTTCRIGNEAIWPRVQAKMKAAENG